MEILKKFDAQNYKDTTSVFEKYTIRGIIVRDGKIAMQCSKRESIRSRAVAWKQERPMWKLLQGK